MNKETYEKIRDWVDVQQFMSDVPMTEDVIAFNRKLLKYLKSLVDEKEGEG